MELTLKFRSQSLAIMTCMQCVVNTEHFFFYFGFLCFLLTSVYYFTLQHFFSTQRKKQIHINAMRKEIIFAIFFTLGRFDKLFNSDIFCFNSNRIQWSKENRQKKEDYFRIKKLNIVSYTQFHPQRCAFFVFRLSFDIRTYVLYSSMIIE